LTVLQNAVYNAITCRQTAAIILIPFIILGASRTHSHKVEADAARMQAETARMQYELNLAEY